VWLALCLAVDLIATFNVPVKFQHCRLLGSEVRKSLIEYSCRMRFFFMWHVKRYICFLYSNHCVFFYGILQPKPLKNLNGQTCQICGDNVGVTENGDIFVACNECAFPVCRPCYEYERKDGTQSCPQCKTRYRRHKG